MAQKRRRKRNRFADIMSGLLMAIALVVFLFSGYMLYGFYKEYKAGTDEYDNLENSYTVQQESEQDFDELEDDSALQEVGGHEVRSVMYNGQEIKVPVVILKNLKQ